MCGFVVTGVKYEAITESKAAASRDRIVAFVRLILEIFIVVLTEGIGSKETVVARHPPRGMPQILWIIEDRYAVSFAFTRRRIIAPISAFAPCVGIARAGARTDVATTGKVLLLVFMWHGHPLGQADGHCSVFVVADEQRFIGKRVQGHLIIDHAKFLGSANADGPVVGADEFYVRCDPAVPGLDYADVTTLGLGQRLVDNTSFVHGRFTCVAVALVPEIDAIDRTVGEP